MPKSSRHIIRNLDDFVSVPESEMVGCLRSFREWIAQRKKLLATVQIDGSRPPEFVWQPKGEGKAKRPLTLAPVTDVRELDLRPSALHHFRKMNLYALEDFTTVCEHELMTLPDVGAATVRSLREQLLAIGLDFKPPSSPHRVATGRALVARAKPIEQRRIGLGADSSIGDLGMKNATTGRCLEKNIETLGKLQRLTLRDLHIAFGRKTILEIISTLDALGIALESNPTQLEKWRYGAISREALKYPDEEADVRELAPWIGGMSDHVAKAGVSTVGQLRALARSGGASIRGLGKSSWDRVFQHFGVRRR